MRRVSARLIVGRGPEMEALSQAAARTSAGQPSVVLVLGEPGIGKSRLVADWSAGQKAHGWLALTGRCVELAGPALPLAAVGDALRDLLRQVGDDRVRELAGRWRDALAPLLPELRRDDGVPGHDFDRSSLFEGVASLLSRLAAEQPVVLVVEDLHWADASTRDLVSYLLHTTTDERVLLVLTLRDEGSPGQALERFLAELSRQPAVEQLSLGRLSRAEVAAQVADITGQPAQPGRLARIADLSDGIPFLVEELLAEPAGPGGAPSDRVRRIVLARLAGLSSQARRLVEAASLAEAELSDRLLRTVLTDPGIDVDEALRAAVGAAVLVAVPEEERLRFRHALLRLAVAESMLPGERRAWHLRWAMAIEASPEPPDALQGQVALAHHWDAAGEAARALPATLRAAQTCCRQGAFTEQSVLLRRALELWDQVADADELTGLTRNRLVDDTHDALDAALEHQASEAMLEAELMRPEVAADPLRHLLVRLSLSGSRAWQGRHDMDLPEREPAIRLARGAAPTRDKVKVLQDLCWWVNWTDPAMAQGLIDDAVRTAQAIGDEQLLLAARVDRANQRCFLGRHEESFREYAELRLHLARMDPARAALAQYFLVILPLNLGRLEEAAVEAETARARLGSAAAAPAAWASIAWPYAETLLALGRWSAARQVLDEARNLPLMAYDPADRLYLDSGRGLLAVWQGDSELATAMAEIAVPAGGETPASIWDGPLWLRAEVALADGDAERAREILRPAWTKPDLIAHAEVVRRLLAVAARAEAEICLTARRDVSTLRESADMVRTLRHVAAQLPPCSPPEHAADLQLEAELARRAGEPALARWQAAEAAWGGMGFPHERGWTLLRIAESHLQVGASQSRHSATAALRSAAEIAERLAARPLGTEVAALARRARLDLQAAESAPAHDRRPGGERVSAVHAIAGTLTERETEVLELMIDGQTNREIGKRLYMSPKTASVHVSRIIMKLGAANRTQAATIGYRLASGRGH